jgi:hypothetical protein
MANVIQQHQGKNTDTPYWAMFWAQQKAAGSTRDLAATPAEPTPPHQHEPDDYKRAKKRLKKAIMEFYR